MRNILLIRAVTTLSSGLRRHICFRPPGVTETFSRVFGAFCTCSTLISYYTKFTKISHKSVHFYCNNRLPRKCISDDAWYKALRCNSVQITPRFIASNAYSCHCFMPLSCLSGLVAITSHSTIQRSTIPFQVYSFSHPLFAPFLLRVPACLLNLRFLTAITTT